MTALQLVQDANSVLFLGIFALVAITAFRKRTRTALDAALLFGALALILLVNPVAQLLRVELGGALTLVLVLVLMALPYLMLRLLIDFADVPLLVRAATLGGLIATVIVFATGGTPLDPAVTLFIVGYFAAVSLYAAFGFVRLARRSSGVTRRRTQAVAAGMGFFGLAILVVAASTFAPSAAGLVSGVTQVLALFAALSWVLGFVPPAPLRRYSQQPDMPSVLRRAAPLPRL